MAAPSDTLSVLSHFQKGSKRSVESADPDNIKDWGARKRELGKFQTRLNKAPLQATETYNRIKGLPSRGYNKTELLHKLDDLLVNDIDRKDRFWTQVFEKAESGKTTEKGVWMLRSRVDRLLGKPECCTSSNRCGLLRHPDHKKPRRARRWRRSDTMSIRRSTR